MYIMASESFKRMTATAVLLLVTFVFPYKMITNAYE
jgi:hypothetical protein